MSVLVIPVRARAGASPQLAAALTLAVVHLAGKHPGLTVLSMDELESTMAQERLRQLAGCESVSCAVEIAGALNTEEILVGELLITGGTCLFGLTRAKSANARVAGRAMARVPVADADTLVDKVPSMVAELFSSAPATAAPAKPPASSRSMHAPTPKPATPPGVTTRRWAMFGAGAAASGVGMVSLVLASSALLYMGAVTFILEGGSPPGAGVRKIDANQALLFNVAEIGVLACAPAAVLLLGVGVLSLGASWWLP